MFIITSVLMMARIRTGKALDAAGHAVALKENPLYFWLATIFNFTFLLSLSITMIVLPLLE